MRSPWSISGADPLAIYQHGCLRLSTNPSAHPLKARDEQPSESSNPPLPQSRRAVGHPVTRSSAAILESGGSGCSGSGRATYQCLSRRGLPGLNREPYDDDCDQGGRHPHRYNGPESRARTSRPAMRRLPTEASTNAPTPPPHGRNRRSQAMTAGARTNHVCRTVEYPALDQSADALPADRRHDAIFTSRALEPSSACSSSAAGVIR